MEGFSVDSLVEVNLKKSPNLTNQNPNKIAFKFSQHSSTCETCWIHCNQVFLNRANSMRRGANCLLVCASSVLNRQTLLGSGQPSKAAALMVVRDDKYLP